MLVLSVCMAFVFGMFGPSQFSFGGAVGNMIADWLKKILGTVGTAALLLVVAISYVIWQFNPAFNMPKRKKTAEELNSENEVAGETITPVTGKTINDVYAENGSGNNFKTNGEPIILTPVNTGNQEFTLIEKDELIDQPIAEVLREQILPLTAQELQSISPKEEIKPVRKTVKESIDADIALEIKEFPKEPVEEEEKGENVRKSSAL